MPGKRKPQAFRRRGSPRAKSRSTFSKAKPRRRQKSKPGAVPIATLRERSLSARTRSLHVLADMRRGASFSHALRDNGVTAKTVRKYLGSALLQARSGGRIRATKSDRFVQYLQIPGPGGSIEVRTRGSKDRTDASRYKSAVTRYLRGDLDALKPWREKKIAGVELITDGQVLKGLAKKESLPYGLYRSLSGGGR